MAVAELTVSSEEEVGVVQTHSAQQLQGFLEATAYGVDDTLIRFRRRRLVYEGCLVSQVLPQGVEQHALPRAAVPGDVDDISLRQPQLEVLVEGVQLLLVDAEAEGLSHLYGALRVWHPGLKRYVVDVAALLLVVAPRLDDSEFVIGHCVVFPHTAPTMVPTMSIMPLKTASLHSPIHIMCVTSSPTSPTKKMTIRMITRTEASEGSSSVRVTRLVDEAVALVVLFVSAFLMNRLSDDDTQSLLLARVFPEAHPAAEHLYLPDRLGDLLPGEHHDDLLD